MKLTRINKGILIIVFILLISPIRGSSEFPITKNPADQYNPAIYGDIVVWEDNRNGNEDIYGYYLSTTKEFQITTDSKDQYNPAIYGDIVVWEDNRNGNKDIYAYNLKTKEEFPITTHPAHQHNPALYGNTVVWVDHRNGNEDIYAMNLKTKKEIQITEDEYSQAWPAIYENIIVWMDYKNDNADIYAINLKTKKEFPITTHPARQYYPALYGNTVVWVDYRNGNEDIYGYNIVTHQEFPITTNPSVQWFPTIHKHIVVWTDYRHCSTISMASNIYGYNLLTHQEFRITPNSNVQFNPALYENTIVWRRNVGYPSCFWSGNPNLFGYDLSTLKETHIPTKMERTPSQKKVIEPKIKEKILLEEYSLKGMDVTVCFRNMTNVNSIIESEYHNICLVNATLDKVIPGNSLVCFKLRGTYGVGDTVSLVSKRGTHITFEIGEESPQLFFEPRYIYPEPPYWYTGFRDLYSRPLFSDIVLVYTIAGLASLLICITMIHNHK